MEELTIVLGLIIIITIFLMYNKSQTVSSCDEYVTYFDKMYYDIPTLKTVPKSSVVKTEGLNDMKTLQQQLRKCTNVGDGTNVMKTRWSCYVDTLEKHATGSNKYSNMDVQMNPKSLQHNLGYTPPELLSGAKYNVKSEPFADDAWLDPEFSYKEKYFFDKSDLTYHPQC